MLNGYWNIYQKKSSTVNYILPKQIQQEHHKWLPCQILVGKTVKNIQIGPQKMIYDLNC